MIIIQRPEGYSLSKTMKPLIIDSQEDVTIKITHEELEEVILNETYTPDSKCLITAKDYGDVCGSYLFGVDIEDKDMIEQNNIMGNFTIEFSVYGININVLKCMAIANIAGHEFQGKRFLNMQHKKKNTSLYSKEYLTFLANGPKRFAIEYYIDNGEKITSISKSYAIATKKGFCTVDVSPVKLLVAHNIQNCIGYKLSDPDGEYIEYSLLQESESIHQIKYKNVFDVPETFTAYGEYIKKAVTNIEETIIDGETTLESERADEFELTLKSIVDQNDKALISELISSSEIYYMIDEVWKKIVITKHKIEESSLPGTINDITITFKFADKNENITLL